MKAKSSKTHQRRGISAPDPVLVPASFGQISYIENLLETCILGQEVIDEYYARVESDISEGEAEMILTHLVENQRDNIAGGFNYSQGDILKKLSKFIT